MECKEFEEFEMVFVVVEGCVVAKVTALFLKFKD